MQEKIDVIIQARLGSRRLPKKVIADINGKSMLDILIKRIKKSKKINEIIIATTTKKIDDLLFEKANKLDLKVIRGSEIDVLARFMDAAKISSASYFIRVTADCPLIDHHLIDDLIDAFKKEKVDYLSNCYPPNLPDGFDLEIFTKDSLIKANRFCSDIKMREHVTPWIRESGQFKVSSLNYNLNLSNLRLTVDESEDLILIKEILKNSKFGDEITWKEIIKLLNNKPELVKINSKYIRNEGSMMDESQKLWRRAKKIIPSGNMLLSKRPEMFLPDKWPAYFSKTKGCYLWDMENKKYGDMALMGVGTNSLGYSHPEVDEAVSEVIKNGNMSSLNCPEEVLLAEKLIEIHPWAEMVKFARTGGEANAISIRIARAASNKDTVAICGYHGWHDWYLATNLKDEKGLEEHLLAGLQPLGVPKGLKGSVIPFSFNNLKQLEEISRNHDLAAIKLEIERSVPPTKEFLEGLKRICKLKNIILIIDECTSGFRETFGGLHKKYKIEPDIAIFGKALGNGYAITSIIGKRSIMDAAQSTFISSTFWTERIGPTAALKTLEIMEREKSWEQITKKGEILRNIWSELAKNNDLEIAFHGIKALSGFSFKGNKNREYKTLISQEMLKRGFLASTVCYLSTAHDSNIFDNYAENLNEVFKLIAKCENGLRVENILENPLCHQGFQRLN